MKKGEKYIIGGIVVLSVFLMVQRGYQVSDNTEKDPGIPYFSTADNQLKDSAAKLIRDLGCRDCHSLWAIRDLTASVPAPALDGMGSFRDEAWLFNYFSAAKPQDILPTRLKEQYRMPSYAHLPEADRRTLAAYIYSLKVQDWYKDETEKARQEKLTGKPYVPNTQQ